MRHISQSYPPSLLCFNPRTHKGCDTYLSILPPSLLCFNPRTHKGCDASLVDYSVCSCFVSIHAPIKDATQFRGFSYKEIIVSIHAPIKDATYADDVPNSDQDVSIHAPIKDATISLNLTPLAIMFQSTHP